MLITTRLRSWIRESLRDGRRRRSDVRSPQKAQLAVRQHDVTERLEDRTLLAAALVGVDFGDDAVAKAPSNWSVISGFSGSGTTASNLTREDLTATTIDLFVDTADPNGTTRVDSVLDGGTIAASTVPQHANALQRVDGIVLPDDESSDITARWSDLVAGKLYEVYVFAHEADGFTTNQSVNIVGGNTVSFTQNVTSGNLTVNASQGSSAQNLSDFAQFVSANGSGEINITISRNSGAVLLAALAIREAEFNVQIEGNDLLVQDISDSGDNNAFTITTTATHAVINDANQTLTTIIPGATGNGTNTVTVPLSSFSGDIRVLTAVGNDSVSTTTPSRLVEIDARGTGAKSLTVNGTNSGEEYFVEANEFNMIGDTLTVRNGASSVRVEALNVTTFTLNMLNGNDTVNVANMSILGVDNGAALQNFNINLGDGNDTLAAILATNALNVTAGLGADSLQGGTGNDTLSGGDGSDTIDGGSGNDAVTGNADDDLLSGGADDDTVNGGSGNDTLSGNGGTDTLSGGTGDDTYLFDADFLLDTEVIVENPGAGTDTLDFSPTSSVGVSLNLLTQTPQTAHATRLTLDIDGVEFENVIGTDQADNILGNERHNVLTGGPGNDTLDGQAGADTTIGGDGDDRLAENSQFSGGDADLLDGGAGNDTLLGFGGNDTLVGGSGNDSLLGEEGDDTYQFDVDTTLGSDIVTEQMNEGTDLLDFSLTTTVGVTVDLGTGAAQTVHATNLMLTLNGADHIENLTGGGRDDNLQGQAAANRIEGGGGNDLLQGHGGNDTIDGGANDDTISGGDAADFGQQQLIGGSGNDLHRDTIPDGTGWDLVYGEGVVVIGEGVMGVGAERAEITANSGGSRIDGTFAEIPITLIGGNGNDELIGGNQADSIDGGGGNDTVTGGIGNDALFGGIGGTDLFREQRDANFLISFGEATTIGSDSDFATGFEAAELIGGPGNNRIEIFNDVPVTLRGGGGNDTLRSAGGNDLLEGGEGDDSLTGLGGDDTIRGGAGTNVLNGGNSGDDLFSVSGTDVLDAGGSSDIIEFDGVDVTFPTNLPASFFLPRTTLAGRHDQVRVLGSAQTVTLGNAELTIDLGGFTPAVNDTFTIIELADAGSAVSGTFDFNSAALPQGGTFTLGMQRFQIDYAGGDGNDVVLTALGKVPIVVDIFTDEDDGNTSVGDLSLREAIGLANGSAGADTITFDPTVFNTPRTILLDQALGQMEITEDADLTITGPGRDLLTIDAQLNSRIFDAVPGNNLPGDFDLTLSGLTLTRGRTTGNNDDIVGFVNTAHSGGAVRFNSIGTLTIDATAITDSNTQGVSARGGGIFTRSSVTLTNSTVSGNSTEGSSAGGGGIRSEGGNVTLTNSTVSGNSTAGDDANGGGIRASNNVTLTSSTVSGNTTAGDDANGGGIRAGSNVTLTSSTVSGNSTAGDNADGGGISVGNGTISVIGSTITDNHATGPNSAGGGIFHSNFGDDGFAITNSIIAGNTATDGGPDFRPNPDFATTVTNSLIGNNSDTGLTAAPVGSPDGNGNLIGDGLVHFPFSPAFNADAVVNKSGGMLDTTQNAPDFTSFVTETAGADSGINFPANQTLPDDGIIPAGRGDLNFDVPLSYSNDDDGNNALKLTDADPTAVLPLPGNLQGRYSELIGYGLSTEGAEDLSVTLGYSDMTTDIVTLSVPDWFTDPGEFLINGLRRVTNSGTPDATASDPGIFALRIPADITKTLESITLTRLDTGGSTAGATTIFGASGFLVETIIDPLLGPLNDNGGPTETHALQSGSPAIDAGADLSGLGITTDQRGEPRVQDGDGDSTATTDMGAFEAASVAAPVTVDLPASGGGFLLFRDGDDLVLSPGGGGAELLRQVAGTISELTINGSANVDVVTVLDNGTAVETPLIFDGLGGDDRFNASSATGPVTLDGGAGNDFLAGGSAADSLSGGSGRDTIDGNAGDDLLFGQGGTGDSLTGGLGNDTLHGGSGVDRVFEVADGDFTATLSQLNGTVTGTDTLISVEQARLAGGAGNNTLDATAFDGFVVLFGQGGNDTLLGGPQVDILYGNAGEDLERGFDGDDLIFGGSENDVLEGGNGNDTIRGAAGRDTLRGEAGEDFLLGQGGTGDILSGGAGNDTLDGGSGVDRVFEEADTDFLATNAQLEGGVATGTDALISVEQARLAGGAGSNTLDATAFNGFVVLLGHGGNDALLGGPQVDILYGGDGNDTIRGNDSNDLLYGEADDDLIEGGNGNDSIRGAAGRDTLRGEAGEDLLLGQGGSGDILTGGADNDTLDGGPGTDRVLESADTDFTLTNGQLNGGSATGIDTLISIEQAALFGGAGNNTIDASAYTLPTTLSGGDGDDVLTGGSGVDFILGGANNDTLRGLAGNDLLFGEAGDDSLLGGDDVDSLNGGNGSDTANGEAGADTVNVQEAPNPDGIDTVIDDALDTIFMDPNDVLVP